MSHALVEFLPRFSLLGFIVFSKRINVPNLQINESLAPQSTKIALLKQRFKLNADTGFIRQCLSRHGGPGQITGQDPCNAFSVQTLCQANRLLLAPIRQGGVCRLHNTIAVERRFAMADHHETHDDSLLFSSGSLTSNQTCSGPSTCALCPRPGSCLAAASRALSSPALTILSCSPHANLTSQRAA